MDIINLNKYYDKWRESPEDPILSAQTARIEQLLTTIHGGLYINTFPNATERQPLEYWIERMRTDKVGQGITEPSERISLAGNGLVSFIENGGQEPEVAAFRLAIYFPESQTGLNHYMLKNSNYALHSRGADGSKTRNPNYLDMTVIDQFSLQDLEEVAAASGRALNFLVCEVDDPSKVTAATSAMAPEARLSHFEGKFGRKELTVNNYLQADLGYGTCDTLVLMSCPLGDGRIGQEPQDLINHMQAYFPYFARTANRDNVLHTDAGRALMEELERIAKGEQPLFKEPRLAAAPTHVPAGVEARMEGVDLTQKIAKEALR